MTSEDDDNEVRRVVAALDGSPHSLAALQAAVDLAAGRRLEVLALFVEDLRWLRATALPFAREVGAFSGVARPLGPQEAERRLQGLARRLESLVAAAAARSEVRWSFRVRRGDVVTEILATVESGDLLSVGPTGWSPVHGRLLGDTALHLLRLAPGPVMLARHGTRLRLPLLALLEDAAWRDALATAVAIAGRAPGALVLGVAPGRGQAARESAARDVLRRLGAAPARTRLLAGAGPAALRAVARREGAGALLLPAGAGALAGDAGQRLLATAEVPVVVVPPAVRRPARELPRGHEQSPLG